MNRENNFFPKQKQDRRILQHIPDPEGQRTLSSRRGLSTLYNEKEDVNLDDSKVLNKLHQLGTRYEADFPVNIYEDEKWKNYLLKGKCQDLSLTGMYIAFEKPVQEMGENIFLKFQISPGTISESFERNIKIGAKVIRFNRSKEGVVGIAIHFEKDLYSYMDRGKWQVFESIALASMFVTILCILLMRVESVKYYVFNIPLYTYSILTAAFLLSRYLFSAFYRNVKIDEEFTPGVSIIIPCFNEEEWIARTITSCINQYYPPEQIEVIIVDDGSKDKSVERILEHVKKLSEEGERFNVADRLKVVLPGINQGKRHALIDGMKEAKFDLITFVDSDSFLDPFAIKHLVQPFRDPKVGGVTGRTEVENKWTNYVTKMQAVRYYISFRVFKAAESVFDAVTCLSGPLSCYKRELLEKHTEAWLNQKFLGIPATFGDDRSMTNFILKTHRTVYQDQAVCSTIVPDKGKVFLKQQMRWKRSWLRESLRAGMFMWKKEPFMAISFYLGLCIPVLSPLIVIYNLIIMPIFYGVQPFVFIFGLFVVALLMSGVYLLLRKSKLWLYGGLFCLYYVLVLIWQMPIACLTFWKSTWGTRPTPQDEEEQRKKEMKKQKNNINKREEV